MEQNKNIVTSINKDKKEIEMPLILKDIRSRS